MTYQIKNVCVYCGSSVGNNPAYREAAVALGKMLVERNIGLVFGGGSVGLMGIVADTILDLGGRATGIIPAALDRREIKHTRLTELHMVETMHERKALMATLADGFIALPGGYGTFEELLEALTWSQIGIHHKPVAMLNIGGYYDPLLVMIQRGFDEQFIPEASRTLLLVGDTPEAVLNQMEAYNPNGYTSKWEKMQP